MLFDGSNLHEVSCSLRRLFHRQILFRVLNKCCIEICQYNFLLKSLRCVLDVSAQFADVVTYLFHWLCFCMNSLETSDKHHSRELFILLECWKDGTLSQNGGRNPPRLRHRFIHLVLQRNFCIEFIPRDVRCAHCSLYPTA